MLVDATSEIFGDVPNIAARAQALAEPAAIVVTAGVQRQVAGLFVAEERGSHELKGVPEPVTLYQIVRASGGGRRSGARQLTPLVGRDDEMTMLVRRWEWARAGDGQLLLIIGEPGLGKRVSIAVKTVAFVQQVAIFQRRPLNKTKLGTRIRLNSSASGAPIIRFSVL